MKVVCGVPLLLYVNVDTQYTKLRVKVLQPRVPKTVNKIACCHEFKRGPFPLKFIVILGGSGITYI